MIDNMTQTTENTTSSKIIGVEDWMWYDWIAYYLNEETWKRFSRNMNPIDDDEMCKYNTIYKVKQIVTWTGRFDYYYKILSSREDK